MAQRMNNLTGKEWLMNSFSIWRELRKTKEESKLKHPAMFPVALAEKLINVYTKEEGEVILDPFVGSGSTVLAALNLQRKGIGFDLSEEYINTAKARVQSFEKELKQNGRSVILPDLYQADSGALERFVARDSVDLSISSPPYWDILNQRRTADKKERRNYGDRKDDLGNISNYDEFLCSLKKVYSQVYDVLKPNKRCCVVVMDLRKKDKFYPLHIDITKMMQEIGFELEEFMIWDRQHEYNNMKTLGYPWVFRVNKVHEFICVYWKRALKLEGKHKDGIRGKK
jgi:DNA modification methylase